jgi:uncharacterized protein
MPGPMRWSLAALSRATLLWAATGTLGAQAASFPCEQARSKVEKAICASPEVSELDGYLARYFDGLRLRFQHAPQCVTQDQRAWLKDVRNACPDTACLQQAYLQRLAVLHAVQPGVSALTHLKLPAVPPLVWIVPPAADEVATPRNRPSALLSLSGQLVNDIADGDGLVLKTVSGDKHVIVPAMLLDEPTASELIGLTKLPGGRFLVKGRADADARKPQAFSSGHCTHIYRLQP